MARYTGFSTETKHRLVVDAGAVYLNYGEATERLLGATRDGAEFVVEQDVREIDVDGLPGPAIGMRRIIRVRAALSVNLMEITPDNLVIALAGAESDTSDVTHDLITRSRAIAAQDYFDNVALVGTYSGSDDPVVCLIHNALADGNLTFNTSDDDELVIEMQFTAHFSDDPDEFDTEPWEIRIPKAVGS